MKKENLNKSKILVDEKISIQKSNILKKHEIELKTIESELEQNFNKNKEILKSKKLNTNKSVSNIQNYLINNDNNKNIEINDPIKSQIFENYQKALDDEYEINCKAVNQELNLTKIKELKNFNEKMENDKQDQINIINKKISFLEEEYFNSLNNIREQSKKLNEENTKI